MSLDFAVRTHNLGKCYQIYDQPLDRLKQSLWRARRRFYREFWALRDCSFEIKKGETVGIIGSNGSGKSTLLQIICGTLNPTEGELAVSGRIAALLELGAGFNPEFTGRENVYMSAAIMGISRSEIESQYDEIAAFAGIGGFMEQPVKMYSNGMYVRLAFAVAIHVSPDILVVDEALAVGDARFQQKCMARIRAFCQAGTVIFVSHDTAAVTELCSRAIWIESGKIVMDGLPKLVVEKYLQFMYEENGSFAAPVLKCEGASRRDFNTGGFTPVGDHIRQFGDRRVTIEAVRLVSRGGGNGVAYSGQACEIGMALHAHQDIANPIVGFIVRDRLGREILGDNTQLIKKELQSLLSGRRYVITFEMDAWPNLAEGEYTLTVAVADGTQSDHMQCHYLHDAVIFKSVPVRMPAGIFSVPNTKVGFFQEDN
ncbi:MAG: ABC transporter ATP-binding protein [Deltaproteobacteria bacterium]|nr:ABC transporter ATP-binding protein [Deltaproteobacteria bacterium]